MSATLSPDEVLKTRGVSRSLEAYVVAAVFARNSRVCAFAMGDGSIHISGPDAWTRVEAHDGGVLSLAADLSGGWLSGGDDGRFLRIGLDGSVTELANYGMKWVENVAAGPDGKGGVLACSVGKYIHVFDAKGQKLKSLEHPSSVTGIAFDAKGKRIAASHYNGASVWFVASKSDNPRRLEWKGSHTGVAMHPEGESVVTAMQENSLHGWRLADTQHMRMTGYPSKTRALGFTRNGKWLATSGADSIVLWPFFGGGPMGKPPTELAGGDDITCTLVACHPSHEAVAAGFADGMVIVADINSARILPVTAGGEGPISALGWNADGTLLAFGTETGFAAVVDFSKK